MAVADLQGDGLKELVVGSNGYDIYALRANGAELMDGDSNPATLGVFKHTGAMYNYGSPALAPLQLGEAAGTHGAAFCGCDPDPAALCTSGVGRCRSRDILVCFASAALGCLALWPAYQRL